MVRERSPGFNQDVEILPGDDLREIFVKFCDLISSGQNASLVGHEGRREEINREKLLLFFDGLLSDPGEFNVITLLPGDERFKIPSGSTTSEDKLEVRVEDRSLESLKKLLEVMMIKPNVQVVMQGRKFRLTTKLFNNAMKNLLGEKYWCY
jgi:hypothetical protein